MRLLTDKYDNFDEISFIKVIFLWLKQAKNDVPIVAF